MTKRLQVAVAVIQRKDGKILFAERPTGKACAGEWEFPGGKVEAGETPRQALVREIDEELSIRISSMRPWITLTHDYPHAAVNLKFFIVNGWTGELQGAEGQRLSWQDINALSISPLLAANAPVIRALRLPDVYAISSAGELGEDKFIERLPKAIANGMRLLQLREKDFSACQLRRLVDRLLPLTVPAGVMVLYNSAMPAELRKRFSGLHLTSTDLMRCSQRPDFEVVGASCHNLEELQQAARLELDFAVISPVHSTRTHPQAEPLGVERMAEIIRDCPIPVYALGGMTQEMLSGLQFHGAHGIAMMRGAWQQ